MDLQYIVEKTRITTNYVTKYDTGAEEKSNMVDALQGINKNKSFNSQLWAERTTLSTLGKRVSADFIYKVKWLFCMNFET